MADADDDLTFQYDGDPATDAAARALIAARASLRATANNPFVVGVPHRVQAHAAGGYLVEAGFSGWDDCYKSSCDYQRLRRIAALLTSD